HREGREEASGKEVWASVLRALYTDGSASEGLHLLRRASWQEAQGEVGAKRETEVGRGLVRLEAVPRWHGDSHAVGGQVRQRLQVQGVGRRWEVSGVAEAVQGRVPQLVQGEDREESTGLTCRVFCFTDL